MARHTTPTVVDGVIEMLRAYIKASGMPKNELALRAAIHHNSLIRVERRDWAPSLPTLRALERAAVPAAVTTALLRQIEAAIAEASKQPGDSVGPAERP